jgi:hypothetical protein
MSDAENRQNNARYKEGYDEGRTGTRDPLKDAAEALFFGPDKIKEAGRDAGKTDRGQYDRTPKRELEASSGDGAKTHTISSRQVQHAPSSGGSSGAGEQGAVFGLLALGLGALLYIGWIVSVMNNGGPSSLVELLLLLPGLVVIFYVGFYIGVAFIGIFLACGMIYLIFSVIFG